VATPYGHTAVTSLAYDAALAHLRCALAGAGWTIVFELDPAPPRAYRIVGAFERTLFDEALAFENDAGLLLPWSFIVAEDLGSVTVSAVDTHERLRCANNGLLNAVADRAAAGIAAILAGFPAPG
jgi:uncharacterized protein (DUF302 family)